MLHINRTEFDQILSDPSSCYQTPDEVLQDERLSREQKIQILKQWAFDERELEVAEEENMTGGDSPPLKLNQILLALREIEEE